MIYITVYLISLVLMGAILEGSMIVVFLPWTLLYWFGVWVIDDFPEYKGPRMIR